MATRTAVNTLVYIPQRHIRDHQHHSSGRVQAHESPLSMDISITVPASKATSGDPKFQGAGAQAAIYKGPIAARASFGSLHKAPSPPVSDAQTEGAVSDIHDIMEQSSWLHSLTPSGGLHILTGTCRGTEETQSLLLLYPSDALIDLESSIRSEL
jgi:hypothetical protein